MEKNHLPYSIIGIIIITYLILPHFLLFMKNKFNPSSNLKITDYYCMSLVFVFTLFGCYQLYLWAQKAYIGEPSTVNESIIDRLIPKVSSAVYVYNLLFYIVFSLTLITVNGYKQFFMIVVLFMVLFIINVAFFCIFPTKLPDNSRDEDEENYLLKMTHSFDSCGNAYPSAHVALSILIYFILKPYFGDVTIIFPILIILSCLMTKQHFVVDCIGGVIYGVLFVLVVKYYKIYRF